MAKFSALALLLLTTGFVSAIPVSDTIDIAGLKNIHWPKGRPLPVKITKTPSGQRIGWVKRHEQVEGGVASPPPPTDFKEINGRRHPKSELLEEGVETGPEGTVPYVLLTAEEVANIPTKKSPPKPHQGSKLTKRAGNGHYYGNSGQSVQNWGGCAYVSLFDPAVATSGSMSLIQVAITMGNQTAELGWQVLPPLHNGDRGSYIFIYYTTNGYAQEGDYKGGYNQIYKGYVQYSSTYAPGITFSNYSTVGGTQYEVPISYSFYQGNWWISVNNNYMGYYPGSLYARGGSTANTLGAGSNYLLYYGEVYDDPATPPKTDMGSGQFANTGFGKAGYMHNIVYYKDSNQTAVNYNGVTGISNASWYTIDPHFNSGQSWASFFYVGGPGAG